mmetsp:Transcript_3928/g.10349  ORF Transcript_3928/g.10349 Transcript_3928/m.10349 type:complete len:291 (-) Transcript_3928:150-1022(-)
MLRSSNPTNVPNAIIVQLLCTLPMFALQVLAKGGGGGGGRGGGGGGSGSYGGNGSFHNNQTNNSNDDPVDLDMTMIGIILGVSAACIGLGVAARVYCSSRNAAPKSATASSFVDQSKQAKINVLQSSANHVDSMINIAVATPRNGCYRCTYNENDRAYPSEEHLTFEPTTVKNASFDGTNVDDEMEKQNAIESVSGGTTLWKVTGKGSDNDGNFRIDEGYVAANGDAFWVETSETMVGLEVLVTGRFDFVNGKIDPARWVCNKGTGGELFHFVLDQAVEDGTVITSMSEM